MYVLKMPYFDQVKPPLQTGEGMSGLGEFYFLMDLNEVKATLAHALGIYTGAPLTSNLDEFCCFSPMDKPRSHDRSPQGAGGKQV